MSKRSHRNRHHGRPGRAPTPLPIEACAFQPCTDPTAWVVAGPCDDGSAVAVGLAFVCDAHLTESVFELGTIAEPIVAPIDEAAEVLAVIDEFAREAMRHAS
jgi:hypothetical protein